MANVQPWDLGTHPMHDLIRRAISYMPGVSVKLDAPAKDDGHWFVDLKLGTRGACAEWRGGVFGVSSSAREAGYGEGPEETFDDVLKAAVRISAILRGYLGEEMVTDLTDTPYAGFDEPQFALEFVGRWGQIDGSHHKAWVLDQVARILLGTPVVVKKASWDSGEVEYRLSTDKPTDAYLAWVEKQKGETDEDGEREYDYAEGVVPRTYNEGVAP